MADTSPIRVHDWTLVDHGTWHSFHYSFVGEIKRCLNNGLLPSGYYADAERRTPPFEPDVLTLQDATDEIMGDGDGGNATVVAAAPKMSLHLAGESSYADLQRRISIRHESGDRLIAILEVTSPANKDRLKSVESFTEKAAAALASGVHVSIVDLLPPTSHDRPSGLVGRAAAAAELGQLDVPPDKPLMVGAFVSRAGTAGYVPVELWAEPLAVGDVLPDLPLFYRSDRFVEVPLAASYAAAWEATPRRWQRVVLGETSRVKR